MQTSVTTGLLLYLYAFFLLPAAGYLHQAARYLYPVLTGSDLYLQAAYTCMVAESLYMLATYTRSLLATYTSWLVLTPCFWLPVLAG